MTTTVTMLQTRRGEDGNQWTAGTSYSASDAFAAMLITANYATGTLPIDRDLVPIMGQTNMAGQVTSLVDGESTNLFAPSRFYKFFIPGQQFIGSGNGKDRSGNSADAALGASLTDAAAWANPGYITTGAGADLFASVSIAKSSYNLATQSIIFSARVKKAAAGTAQYILGNCETSTFAGFSLDSRVASGGVSKVKLRINNGTTLASLADSTATFFEAAATDHVIGVAIDGVTKAAYLWCDGCLSDSYAAAFTGGALSNMPFAIGSNFGNPGNTANVGQFSGIHLLAMTGGLPLNIAQVMQRLAGNPHTPLTNIELQF